MAEPVKLKHKQATPPSNTPETPKNSSNSTVVTSTPSQPKQMNLVIPKDVDRLRARSAWDSVQKVTNNSNKKKHGSLARNMPTYIQVNGLAQTLAFLKAKDEAHHKWSLDSLSTWFREIYPNQPDSFDLLNTIINMDSKTYRLATNESLAFLQWLKRFAEAELGTEE